MSSEPVWWHCRGLRADGSVSSFTAVQSSRHEDFTTVDVSEDQVDGCIHGDDVTCVVRFDGGGRAVSVHVLSQWAAGAPPVWWADVAEPAGTERGGRVLIAYADHGVEAGRLVAPDDVRATGVKRDDQLAALRWDPVSGEIDQIYVSPAARRQSVATTLVIAAVTLNVARGGPRLWGDGQRTAEGQRFYTSHDEWRQFAEEQTHLAPPMTPFDQRLDR